MGLEHLLADIVGQAHVLTDPGLTASYETDWTGRFGGRARAVVRPADAAQVAAVLRACAQAGVPLVPQGGNTGLVGGGVPRGGEIVLSTVRIAQLAEVDAALGVVAVGAGATLAALQAAAARVGEDATLDFAARDSCTVGGVVACDAGGARALRHGTARAHVAGLEAVLADGTVLSRMSGLTKDNAGYDLPALLIGSEGTLAVITRVLWRVSRRLPARVTALIPLASVAEAGRVLEALRAHAPSLEACEFFVRDGLEIVLAHQRRRSPVGDAAVYLLAECAAAADPTGELAEALDAAGVRDAVVADDTIGREGLWALREGHTEAINAIGIPHKLDVGVPLARLGDFLERLPQVVGAAAVTGEARVIPFGHLGDGNVHVNVLGPGPQDDRVDDAVLELVVGLGGTISAEHGVGVAKAAWLERARGADELAAMRAVKGALDPAGQLNPGVVLPL
jgi:FAD/FMN-containing dehydrogenase